MGVDSRDAGRARRDAVYQVRPDVRLGVPHPKQQRVGAGQRSVRFRYLGSGPSRHDDGEGRVKLADVGLHPPHSRRPQLGREVRGEMGGADNRHGGLREMPQDGGAVGVGA
jgi:hypothetical protein